VRPPFNQMDYGSRDAGQPATVPASLDWDLWQGPVKERKFRSGIHPASGADGSTMARGCWATGSATRRRRVWALKLYEADTCEVECEGDEPGATKLAARRRVSWKFPPAGQHGPVHHAVEFGHVQRQAHAPDGRSRAGRGGRQASSAYFGTKGTAVSGWWMNDVRLFPESFMKEVGKPKAVLPRVKGTRPTS